MSDLNPRDCCPPDKYKLPQRFGPPFALCDDRRACTSVLRNSGKAPSVRPPMPPGTILGELRAGSANSFAASCADSTGHQNQKADTGLSSGDAPDIRPSATVAHDNNSFECNDSSGGDNSDGNGDCDHCFSPFPLAIASGDEGGGGDVGDGCYDSDVSDVSSVRITTKTCVSDHTPCLHDILSPRPPSLVSGNSKRIRTMEEGNGWSDRQSGTKRRQVSCASPGMIVPSDCESDVGSYSVDSIDISSQTTMDVDATTAVEFEDDGEIGSGDPLESSKMKPTRFNVHGKAFSQNKMPKKAKNGVPKRPLTAYKLFFREESAKLLASVDGQREWSEDEEDKEKISGKTTPPFDTQSEVQEGERGRGEDAFLESIGLDISQLVPDSIEQEDGGAMKEKIVQKCSGNAGNGVIGRRNQSSLVLKTQEGSKISFQELGRVIEKRWRALPSEMQTTYELMAMEESQRYRSEMEGYYGRGKEDRPQHQQVGKIGTYRAHEQESASSAARQRVNTADCPWYPNFQRCGPTPAQPHGPPYQWHPQQPSPQFYHPSQRQWMQQHVDARYSQYPTSHCTAMTASTRTASLAAYPTHLHLDRPVPRDDRVSGVAKPGSRKNVVKTSPPSNSFEAGEILPSQQQSRARSMEARPSLSGTHHGEVIPDPSSFSMPPPHCIDISNRKSTEPIALPPPRTVVVRDRQTGFPRRYQLMYAAVCMPTEAAKRYMASVADMATTAGAATSVPSVQKQTHVTKVVPRKMNEDMAAAKVAGTSRPLDKFPVWSKSFQAGQRPSRFGGAEATPCPPSHQGCCRNYFFGPPLS